MDAGTYEPRCGHESCRLLAELSWKAYQTLVEDPNMKRFIESDDSIHDEHEAVYAVIERIAMVLLSETLTDAMMRDWFYEHRN